MNTIDRVLIETKTENMSQYTKREIEGARKASNLLAKMGFPPVSQGIEIATRGVNFTVTGADFQIILTLLVCMEGCQIA